MSFARGKNSKAISDRSGMEFPYTEMVREWNGSIVHVSEYEAKHPQLDPPYTKADAIALRNPRVIKFQQPTTVNGIVADSGGSGVQVIDLSLPGAFAYSTFGNSMKPRDPELQNKSREAKMVTGSVTISIT